ncbi:MAG: FKBP-type peptidyl-prolyl cis-trans isomerase [Acidobacteriota bacterium]
MIVHPDLVPVRVLRALIVILTVAAVSSGCAKKTPTSPSENPNLVITDLVVGTGQPAAIYRTVVVNYTGWLYDASKPDGKGAQFDTSIGRGPYTFAIGYGQVIQGWDVGVPGMQLGGKRRLQIPPELAYGAAGQGAIPGNATLIFEIDLLGVA